MQSVTRSNDRPSDPRNREVVFPAGDPQNGNLATPINSSNFTRTLINNLPGYRKGITPLRRGLEVGMAHGYWLIGPFVKLGPLRNTEIANLAGLLSAVGLVVISTLAISLYAFSFPPEPEATITTPAPPAALKSSEGWNEYASGFLIGGIGGAVFAYFILANLDVFSSFLNT
ncbi:MAG: photosystem I reaction center subunit XI [Oculatellaceae cyanobacterium bins.114]|nr:photosystem I reaction center subunit XI [Oculatellaceae cyanobacterium bins.114]